MIIIANCRRKQSGMAIPPGGMDVEFVSTTEELRNYLSCKPKYIFFQHWREKIPEDIYNNFECIGFHMTDLPYGRGGSPLQNLILAGHKTTKLTAFKIIKDMDAGPIYLKEDLELSGRAEDIYQRTYEIMQEMQFRILNENIIPIPQNEQSVTYFKRRLPEESQMTDKINYDFIRMLDAWDYPKAYIIHNDQKIEFSNAKITTGGIEAKCLISLKKYYY